MTSSLLKIRSKGINMFKIDITSGPDALGLVRQLTCPERPVLWFRGRIASGIGAEVRFYLSSVERESGNGQTFNLEGVVGAKAATAFYDASTGTGIINIDMMADDINLSSESFC